ncbi:uncharacterized protein LOC144548118 [Carex rostrata]
MVAEEEEEAGGDLTEEDQALLEAYSQALRDRQKLTGDRKSVRDDASTSFSARGNFASRALSTTCSCDTLALASILTRSPDWIVDSSASRHVTGAAGEFSSYTRLAVPENIQTADGTTQPVVGDLPREGDRQDTWDGYMLQRLVVHGYGGYGLGPFIHCRGS